MSVNPRNYSVDRVCVTTVIPASHSLIYRIPPDLFKRILECLSLSGMNAMLLNRTLVKLLRKDENPWIPFAYKNQLRYLNSEDRPLRYFAECNIFKSLGVIQGALLGFDHLDLSDPNLNDKHLQEIIQDFPNLISLSLSGRRNITDLRCLEGLPLKYLNLAGAQVSDATLLTLPAGLPLRHLTLARAKVTDVGLASLLRYPTIEHLNLHDCQKLSDLGVGSLKGLQNLQYLDCFSCKQLTDLALEYLGQFPALLYLSIGNDNITDIGLGHLAALTRLECLDLTNCSKIQDLGIAHLKTLHSIKQIILYGCKGITDSSAMSLAGLPSLQKIAVKYCFQISDVAKSHLRTSGKLDESGSTLPWGDTKARMGRLYPLRLKGAQSKPIQSL